MIVTHELSQNRGTTSSDTPKNPYTAGELRDLPITYVRTSGLSLVEQIGAYRADYNHVRPHEAIAWNRPIEVHLGHADPKAPNFPEPQNLPST